MHPLSGPKLLPPSNLYNYSYHFKFESEFDKKGWTDWFNRNWSYSIVMSILYVVLIYAGRKYMSRRAAFDLRYVLTLWNFATAAFSFLGFLRMTPEFFYTLNEYGWYASVCTSGYTQLKVAGFWATVFTLSKAVELLDTAFIVLRKRPLIFLHWYHHVTVLLLTWTGYADHTAPARWFIWMNFGVHSLMYSYYGLRAMSNLYIPKFVSITITSLQIAQMFVGSYIAYYIYGLHANNRFCQQRGNHLKFTILVYFSYLLLFLHFFYEAYLKKGGGKRREVVEKVKPNGNNNNKLVMENGGGKFEKSENGECNGKLVDGKENRRKMEANGNVANHHHQNGDFKNHSKKSD